MFFQAVQSFRRSEVLTVIVGDRNAQDLAAPALTGKPCLRIVSAKMDELAQEFEVLVPQHRPRKQPQLQEHLETVADPQDQASPVGEFAHFLHEGGEPGDCARPQVIPISEPAREDDAIDGLEVAVFVPKINGFLIENILENEKSVMIAVRTGEDDDTELQWAKPSLPLPGSPR